jgi:integrase
VLAARQEATPEAEGMVAWGIHDLRRTVATEMGRLGITEFIIGKVLNHAARGITGQVYNQYEYLAEKRHALDTWAAYLDRLLKPAEANVVALRA